MTTRHSARFYRFIGWLGNTRLITRLHPIAYRLTGGRWFTGSDLGVLHVLLTTTGRHSGTSRDVPLFAIRDGDRLVVVGSKNGSDDEPGWVLNLRADPRARVQVGRDVRPVDSHEAEDEERARLWALVVAAYPGYDLYQRRTARRIPVVVLAPAGVAEGA
ncbi:MAG: nitroreductase family deazaflavin-dependent oxidoreductase [Candidatus Limnocylindrales bacterium]